MTSTGKCKELKAGLIEKEEEEGRLHPIHHD
jgi:hypothetical protein